MSGSIGPKLTGNGKPDTSQRVFSVFLGPGIELEVFDEDLTLFPHEYGGPYFIRNCCHDLISLLTKIEAYESCFSVFFLHPILFIRKIYGTLSLISLCALSSKE